MTPSGRYYVVESEVDVLVMPGGREALETWRRRDGSAIEKLAAFQYARAAREELQRLFIEKGDLEAERLLREGTTAEQRAWARERV